MVELPDCKADLAAKSDYRHSHLGKGEDYDLDLSRGGFDSYMADQESKLLSGIVPTLFPGGVRRYLDFACGTGRVTRILEPLADESYGVDVSETMVGQARRKCSRTTFVIGDITRGHLGLQPMNLVSAFRFFGNAQHELRRAVLRTLRGLVAPGGYLIINNHRNPWSLHNLLLCLKGEKQPVDLSYAKLRRLLDESGFRLVSVYGIGLWVFCYRLSQPAMLQSRLARFLEPMSKSTLMTPFCPDMVAVARRVG